MKKLLLLSVLLIPLLLHTVYAEDIEINPKIEIEVNANNTIVNVSYKNQSITFDSSIVQNIEFTPTVIYNLSLKKCESYFNIDLEVNCTNVPDNILTLKDVNNTFSNLSKSLEEKIGDNLACEQDKIACEGREIALKTSEETYKREIKSYENREKYSWGAFLFAILLLSFIVLIPLVKGQKGFSAGFINKPPEKTHYELEKKPEKK